MLGLRYQRPLPQPLPTVSTSHLLSDLSKCGKTFLHSRSNCSSVQSQRRGDSASQRPGQERWVTQPCPCLPAGHPGRLLSCTFSQWLFNVGMIESPAAKSALHPWMLWPWTCPLTLSIPIFLLFLAGQVEGFSKDPEQFLHSISLSGWALHLKWFPNWLSKQSHFFSPHLTHL